MRQHGALSERTRRRVLRWMLAAVGVLAIAAGVAAFAAPGPDRARAAAATVRSITSGAWSNAATWAGGRPPGAGDRAIISAGTVVEYGSGTARVAGVVVEAEGALRFDDDAGATLESSGNIVVDGLLEMKPVNSAVVHTIRFVGVDESAMVGGGMVPLETDVGLWVMGEGRLDLQGAPKTGWTRLAGSAAAGATNLTLEAAPTGWAPGDEIVVTPTQAPTVGRAAWEGFDVTGLRSVSGASVSLASALANPHPVVGGAWRAEVADLTRNVRIEGTPSGHAHTFIQSHRPQVIRHVALRYLGVNQGPTFGRYGLHFHHSHDGSRGSIVEGVVVRDAGNHAFVPHLSHGITFRDTVSFNTQEDAYWWDLGDDSNDTVFDHTMAALVKAGADERGYILAGYALGGGVGNLQRNSVAVGVQGLDNAAGFKWPEGGNGDWVFEEGNVSHNNEHQGYFSWQNSSKQHVIANFATYHNGKFGLAHGAYENRYTFRDVIAYGNGAGGLRLDAKSRSNAAPLIIEDLVVDGGGISANAVVIGEHNGEHDFRAKLRRLTLKNYQGHGILVADGSGRQPSFYDVALSDLGPRPFWFEDDVHAESNLRWQPSLTEAVLLRPAGRGGAAVPDWNASSTPTAVFASQDQTAPTNVRLDLDDGERVSGAVQPEISAVDDVAVKAVDFFVDEDLELSDTSAPFKFEGVWSTTRFPDGVHRLRAQAYDAEGNAGEGPIVRVIVSNEADSSPPTPPKGVTVQRLGGSRARVSWYASSDNHALAGYRVLRNGAVVGVVYADQDMAILDSAAPAGAAFAVQAFDAAGNASAASGAQDSSPPPATTSTTAASTTTTIATTTTAPAPTTTTGPTTTVRPTTTTVRPTTTTAPPPTTAPPTTAPPTTTPTTTTTVVAPPAGLVLAYSFEEGKGAATADRSGNANAGVVSAAVWGEGRFGGGLRFNGSSSLVSATSSESLQLGAAFTLEAWVRPLAPMGDVWRTIAVKESTNHLSYGLYASTNTGVPSVEARVLRSRDARGPARLRVGAWNHVAGVYDGASLRLYVDGQLAAEQAQSGAAVRTAEPFQVGGNRVWGEWFLGDIDEVRVYAQALTAAQIQADMNRPVG